MGSLRLTLLLRCGGERRMMELNAWKDAWVIFKKDLYTERLYLIWNVIFSLYIGAMFSFMLYSVDKAETDLHPMADFFMLMMVPMIGFFYSRRSFNYLRKDSYTQMLWYYRTLPIPAKTIMKSRYLQLIFMVFFSGFIFFTTIFCSFMLMKAEVSFFQFISFALTWIGYALFMNGLYIYMEFLKRGKVYFWMTMILLLVTAIVSAVIAVFHGNLVSYTMEISGRYFLLSPVMWGALLCGVLLLYLTGLLTMRKLMDRDLI
jgi:hypothetical protein